MKCLVLNQLKTPLALEEHPDLQPAAGEVVVQLKAAALNRRDYWITQGMYPGITLPCTLGSDGAGVVSRCGEGVDASWQGQEVILNPGLDWGDSEAAQAADFTVLGLPRNGTFATEIAIPAAQLCARPSHLNWQEAAALPLAGVTAYRAVCVQGQVQAGDTVVITGIGGGVATMALLFAKAAGATVWVTSSSEEKIQRAKELGAAGGFDYTDSDWWKQAAATAGAPQLIVDSGGGRGYGDLLKLAAPGARIVNYGATTGPAEKVDLFKLFWKQLQLIGSTMGSPADFEAMLKMVEEHQIRPAVDQVFPLEDGDTAISRMASAPQFGNVVLSME